jgi:membrane protease YdiL (CAAX protease family)
MALWLLAYLFLGRVFVPLLATLGLPLHAPAGASAGTAAAAGAAGSGGVALAHLALDAAQLGATCAILRLSLGQSWRSLREQGLFCFGWRAWRQWIPAVIAGCLAFPAVGSAARLAAAAGALDPSHHHQASSSPMLPIDGDAVSAGSTLVLEAGAAAAAAPGGGGAAAAAALGYALVVAVCAPLWEEAVFRGFLLPSLAAYGPGGDGGAVAAADGGKGGAGGGGGAAAAAKTTAPPPPMPLPLLLRAVVLSAAAFAGCHFRADTALPMFLLGLLFGLVCVATRGNLAAPVVLHGLWNLWAVAHSALAA